MVAVKYTRELLQQAVATSKTLAGTLRALGIKNSSGMSGHIHKRIRDYGIDTSHFTLTRPPEWGESRRKPPEHYLRERPVTEYRADPKKLRRALLAVGVPYKCNTCPLANEWNGKPLTLEIDHINNVCTDDRRENLQFVCPNCHSQRLVKRKQQAAWAVSTAVRKIKGAVYYGPRRYSGPNPAAPRPDREKLQELLITYSRADVARMYNVSWSAVRKWMLNFDLLV
jgi:DNA-directed RNA polymerase subunit RPC12/RpoP